MSVIKNISINNGLETPVSANLGALASNVDYDGTDSELQSINVQDAIDELAEQNIEFIGTTAQWEALTQEQKAAYEGKSVLIIDDYEDINSGHIIVNNNDTSMTQRSKLKFVGGTITDDSVNDTTVVNIGAEAAIEADIASAADVASIKASYWNG